MANRSLLDAVDRYFERSCTEIELSEYDLDVSRFRKYEKEENTFVVPILRKQESEVMSFMSDTLTGFEPNFEEARCDIKIQFYSENDDIIKFDPPISLYVMKNGKSII